MRETQPANPFVSVIIPAFNRQRVIGRAIKSVLAQTFQDFEIIVVDDGSRDETVKEAIALAYSDSRVRVFRSETNQGAQAARNAGGLFKRSNGGKIVRKTHNKHFVEIANRRPCTAHELWRE
jgi:glycosyltransferase involved in cell wall biosynthesis